MMRAHHLLLALVLPFAALPAWGQQSYEDVVASARNGHGYEPAAVVAGWERDEIFSVLAISRDGERKAAGGANTDWKAVLTTGPRREADNDDDADERYVAPNATAKQKRAPKVRTPPQPMRIITWSSRTCPAVMGRVVELKPLASFVFDPPAMKGEERPAGDGREGLDLWIRAGAAELQKSTEKPDSALGLWFRDSVMALQACPAVSTVER